MADEGKPTLGFQSEQEVPKKDAVAVLIQIEGYHSLKGFHPVSRKIINRRRAGYKDLFQGVGAHVFQHAADSLFVHRFSNLRAFCFVWPDTRTRLAGNPYCSTFQAINPV